MDTSKQHNPGKSSAAPAALPASKTPASLPAPTGGSALSAMTVGALVLGLLVGFGAGVLWNHAHRASMASSDSDQAAAVANSDQGANMDDMGVDVSNAALPSPAAAASSGISVADQSAGSVVKVAHVTLSANAWVAVHDDWSGKPGNILGAQWLPKGSHDNVTVDLLRNTKSGTSYFVTVQDDNGDKQFENRLDLQEKDASGAPVLTMFKAE